MGQGAFLRKDLLSMQRGLKVNQNIPPGIASDDSSCSQVTPKWRTCGHEPQTLSRRYQERAKQCLQGAKLPLHLAQVTLMTSESSVVFTMGSQGAISSIVGQSETGADTVRRNFRCREHTAAAASVGRRRCREHTAAAAEHSVQGKVVQGRASGWQWS